MHLISHIDHVKFYTVMIYLCKASSKHYYLACLLFSCLIFSKQSFKIKIDIARKKFDNFTTFVFNEVKILRCFGEHRRKFFVGTYFPHHETELEIIMETF